MMMKSRTSSDLRKMDAQPTAEWIKNPINVGSIYIKPTYEEITYSECIYQYFYWFCCCNN